MKLLTEKQKLAQKRNWNISLLRGILANISIVRYEMACISPEHLGLYSVSKAQHYVMQALEEIKGGKRNEPIQIF